MTTEKFAKAIAKLEADGEEIVFWGDKVYRRGEDGKLVFVINQPLAGGF